MPVTGGPRLSNDDGFGIRKQETLGARAKLALVN